MQGGGNPRELKRLKGHPLTTTDANLYLRPSTDLRSNTYLVLGHRISQTQEHKTCINMNARSNLYPSTHMGTHTAWFSAPFHPACLPLYSWGLEKEKKLPAFHKGFTIPVCTVFLLWVYRSCGIKGHLLPESKQAIMGLASASTVSLIRCRPSQPRKPGCCWGFILQVGGDQKKTLKKDATIRTTSNLGVCSHRDV